MLCTRTSQPLPYVYVKKGKKAIRNAEIEKANPMTVGDGSSNLYRPEHVLFFFNCSSPRWLADSRGSALLCSVADARMHTHTQHNTTSTHKHTHNRNNEMTPPKWSDSKKKTNGKYDKSWPMTRRQMWTTCPNPETNVASNWVGQNQMCIIWVWLFVTPLARYGQATQRRVPDKLRTVTDSTVFGTIGLLSGIRIEIPFPTL